MNAFSKQDRLMSAVHYLKSFAKVNLSVTVVGKNENKYHLLKSLLTYIDLCDVITIRQNYENRPNFSTTGPFSAGLRNDFDSMDKNLIIRAIQKMNQAYGTPANFDILLDKRIPVTSGMGGGSGNAAAIIRFIDKFFNLQAAKEDLRQIATSIGSDVPFFLQDRTAVCEGIGDIVTPVNVSQEMHGVIICHGIKTSTDVIYKTFAKQNNGHYNQPKCYTGCNQKTPIGIDKIIKIVKNNGNDLTSAAVVYNEGTSRVLSFLNSHEMSLASGMSGAGPTCFAICGKQTDAEKLAFDLSSKFRGCFVKQIKFLPKIDFEEISPTSQPYYDCFGSLAKESILAA